MFNNNTDNPCKDHVGQKRLHKSPPWQEKDQALNIEIARRRH